jgi:uncharacterized protein (TIGR00269 family)
LSAARGCTGCGSPNPAYRRRYSGELLCRACFNTSIIEKTRKTISKYRMLSWGDRVVVAVSGGKDSLSLLHVLKIVTRNHQTELLAVTIDEGIPEYREESLRYAKQVSQSLGIPHYTYSLRDLFGLSTTEALQLRGEGGPPACTICGVLRRRALDIAARELDADVIASAHNLDDVIQTFMINLLTGNIRALWRWSPDATPTEGVFIRRVKPFMEIYEEELAFYAYLNGLPLQSVRCPHASEGLRDKVRSFLNQLEEESPGIKHVLYQSMMSLANLPPVGEAKPIGQCRLCGFPASQPLCSSCRILNYLHQTLNT